MPAPEQTDLQALERELRALAEQRRADGTYPAGIDEQLRSEFQNLLAHARVAPMHRLRQAQARATAARGFELRPYQGTSGPKALASKVVEKAVGYAIVDALGQVQEYAAAMDEVVQALLDLVGPSASGAAHELAELQRRVEALEAGERSVSDAGLGLRLTELERRVDRRGFSPFFDSVRFEARFRGEPTELRERYVPIVHRFAESSPVLDIGCGHGDMLELLRQQGVEASGVDLDARAVADAVAKDLDAVVGDAIEHLASLPDGSLGGIVSLQVVEHLGTQGVLDLVQLCHRKLRPGGQVFIETVNPQSLYVFGHAMYLDPTHTQPIHPDYLAFVFSEAGYRDVSIEYRSPVPDDQQLPRTESDEPLARIVDEMAQKLNALVYGPQDYAIAAMR